MIDIEEVTPPDDQAWRGVLDLYEAKLNQRVLHDALDPIVEKCIKAAVAVCDYSSGDLGISVLRRTFDFHRQGWPTRCADDGWRVIRLPYPPCVTVTSVSYLDANGATQTLSPTAYTVRKPSRVPAEIVFLKPAELPTLTSHPRAVTVRYVAGYGTAPLFKAPENLRQLVSMYAGHFFENPEATVNEPRLIMMNRAVDFGVQFLAKQLRVPHEYRDWD